MKSRNKILIDADACPVLAQAVAVAAQHSLECVIVCDTSHIINIEGCETIIADKGADSADFVLMNRVSPGDIVVTQDYGLAAMCLAKNALALNQNGLIYSDKNIENLLYSRYVNKKIRLAGGRTKGPAKRTAGQDEDFLKAFSALIEKIIATEV